MQTADAGMTVVAGRGVVLVNDFPEANKKLRQPGGIHGAVFDKGYRLSLAFHSQQQPEAGFPQFPNPRLLSSIQGSYIRVTEPFTFKRCFEAFDSGTHVRLVLTVEFNQENCSGSSVDEIHLSRELQRSSCQIKDEVVDQFDGGRLKRQNEARGSNGLDDVLEMNDDQSNSRRSGFDADPRLVNRGKRTFGAHYKL